MLGQGARFQRGPYDVGRGGRPASKQPAYEKERP